MPTPKFLVKRTAMMLDETKYNDLFINKFKVDPIQLKDGFKKTIHEYGYSEEIKMEFYSYVFQTIISQFKKELAKDEKYDYVISAFYQLFIDALEKDNIDSNKFREDLQRFKTEELPKYSIPKKVKPIKHKPVYKTYNLNTKYGRRKAREQAQKQYNELPPKEKAEHNFIAIIICVVICLIMWLLLGTDGFLKWATR